MALSGSFTGTTSNSTVQPKITWSATQNEAENYSTVTATLTYSRTNSGYTTSGTWVGSITINGVKTSATKRLSITHNSNTEAISATVKVNHNNDGTKTITISAEGDISGASLRNTKISSSITLDTIYRKATIASAPNFDDEANPTITYSNPAGNSVTKLEACIASVDGLTIYVPYRDISKTGTSYTFNLTTAERTTLRKAVTKGSTLQVKFYIQTVISGETLRHSLERTLTLVNHTPTISATAVDSNAAAVALTGDANKLIKHFSNAKITATTTPRKEATIVSFEVENINNAQVGSNGSISTTFNAIQGGRFLFHSKDNRGNGTTTLMNKTVIEYIPLTCNLKAGAALADNNTTTITLNISGNYFNDTFGATANSVSVVYRYKADNGDYGSWEAGNLVITKSGNTYKATGTITDLNYLSTYTVQAMAMDKVKTSGIQSQEQKVKTTPVFDWSEDDFNFNVPINMGNVTALRRNAETNELIVSSSGGNIYFRAKGTGDTSVQTIVGATGNLYTSGNFIGTDCQLGGLSILGLAKAISNSYELNTTVTAGTNYTASTTDAVLIGNNLRCYITANRNPASGTGNIANEVVAKMKITHNGKIKSAYVNSFGNGSTGGLASFTILNATNDGTTLQFDISLAATDIALTELATYFILPVTINYNAY